MIAALLILAYAVCVVLNLGMILPAFQREYPGDSPRDNAGDAAFIALFAGLLGPFGVLMTFCLTGFAKQGFKFPFLNWKQNP